MNDEIIYDNTETDLKRSANRVKGNGFELEKRAELKIEEIKDKKMLKVSDFREFLFTQLQANYSIYLLVKRT